jgi:pimeloyl-ACP methyl ester carboxylesterase
MTCKCPPPPHMTCMYPPPHQRSSELQARRCASLFKRTTSRCVRPPGVCAAGRARTPLTCKCPPPPHMTCLCRWESTDAPTLVLRHGYATQHGRTARAGQVSPLYQHARSTAWRPSWRSHVLSIPALRCEAVAWVDKRDLLYK